CGPAHLRICTVCGDDEARREMLDTARIERESDTLGADVDRFEPSRHAALDARKLAKPLPECGADDAIWRHIAECLDTLLACIETRESKSARIGDVDRPDGRGVRRNALPDTERVKDSSTCVAERRRALIEARMRAGGGRYALDEHDPERGLREREREACFIQCAGHH